MAEKTKKKIKIPIAELKQIKLCPFCKGTDYLNSITKIQETRNKQ